MSFIYWNYRHGERLLKLVRKKLGIAVAPSLSENDKDRIREKVLRDLSLANLKKTDGLDIFIKFLDSHLKKDELTNSVEKFEAFESCQWFEGQSITEFISLFDYYYRKK